MNQPHPSDRIAALEWSVHQAMQSTDTMVRDVYLPALQSCLADARSQSLSKEEQQ